ncbi:hypothetical protein [Legionella sainthelensi]|uniref:hypothetical protein n=1 Tax=Legionella sainthelensi TaxID=28087 RepID=UPI000E1FD74F|nr:hypothetical protein [Legionella sainthelensi]
MVIIDLDYFNKFEKALTNRCVQYRWGAQYYFPCCPKDIGINQLEAYFHNLKIGFVFAYNDDSPRLIILEVKRYNSSIRVMCEREGHVCEQEGYLPFLISEIRVDNAVFVHLKVGSYFERDDADRAFVIIEDNQ